MGDAIVRIIQEISNHIGSSTPAGSKKAMRCDMANAENKNAAIEEIMENHSFFSGRLPFTSLKCATSAIGKQIIGNIAAIAPPVSIDKARLTIPIINNALADIERLWIGVTSMNKIYFPFIKLNPSSLQNLIAFLIVSQGREVSCMAERHISKLSTAILIFSTIVGKKAIIIIKRINHKILTKLSLNHIFHRLPHYSSFVNLLANSRASLYSFVKYFCNLASVVIPASIRREIKAFISAPRARAFALSLPIKGSALFINCPASINT